MTHTTNPLISPTTIKSAISTFVDGLENSRFDSLFSVNHCQARFYDKNTSPINHDPSNLIPTQNLDVFYEENSCFYLFTRESFIASNARIGQSPHMFVTPKLE